VGQKARWLDLLAEYNFRILHRAGTAHRNCDALSRKPCERDTDAECSQCRRKRLSTCVSVRQTECETAWDAQSPCENALDDRDRPALSINWAETNVFFPDVSRIQSAVKLPVAQAQSIELVSRTE